MFKNKPNINIIILLFLTIIHFSFPPIFTYDSGHYLSFLRYLDGTAPWSQWNLSRGLIFPLLLKISNLLFGYNSQGILIFTYIFYITFYLLFLKFILQFVKTKYAQVATYSIFIVLIVLNPIITGYFHTILTEFVAVTIMLISFLIGLLWQKTSFFDQTKNKFIFFSLYFIIMSPISWHLKQPNITTTLLPLLAVSLLSIINKTTLRNSIQRTSIIILSLLTLYGSTLLWNNFITKQSNENYYQFTSSFAKETYGPRIWPHIQKIGLFPFLTENFLASINIYQYKRMPEPELYKIEHNFSLIRAAQNSIGYTIFNFNMGSGPGNLQVPGNYPYQSLVNPYAAINPPTAFKSFLKSFIPASNFLFSILFLISPFLLVGIFIKKIIYKIYFPKKSNKIEDIIFICTFIAFFQVFIHISITEILDRYMFPSYPLLLLTVILPTINLFNKIKK